MLGRQAGSTVSVYAQVQCREPKTGQQKVQFSRKTKSFVNLGMINLCHRRSMEKEAKANTKQASLFCGGKMLCTCFYSDCVADELIKGGQGQKYGGIFVYYIFLL